MSNNSIIPISDEQAKLGQEIVGAGRDLGSYLAKILGDLPQDLVGLIIGDKVKARRLVQAEKLWETAKHYLREQQVTEPEPPSLNVVIPILEAAVNENREELQDLWARLLAASMNPKKSNLVRLKFIEISKKFDPLDARVLDWMYSHEGGIFSNLPDKGMKQIQSDLTISEDEILVSLENLADLGLINDPRNTGSGAYTLRPFGREFLRSVTT